MPATATKTFPVMTDVIPPGSFGAAVVDHFEVDPLHSALSSLRPHEYCPAGVYARLRVNGETVMSDTRMERNSNYAVVREARGDVLIAGFGLGMILIPILQKDSVRSVTVVEQCADVASLVQPHIERFVGTDASKLLVIISDIHKWRPNRVRAYDVIYFDIWADICTDNLREMTRLRRAFAPYLRVGGWAACWQQDMLRDRRRREGRW